MAARSFNAVPLVRETRANLPTLAAQQFTGQYPPLEQVTRPNLTTAELAYYSNMAEQTWRAKACFDTAPEGLRPLRVCGKLAWPTAGAKKLLGVAQ
jgi:hypothetical protein